MQLSKYFSLDEMTRSEYAIRKGIDNTPRGEVLENLKMLCTRLDGLCSILAVPVHITSGYRSPKVNAGIGGSKTSAHMVGCAADLVAPEFGTPSEVFAEIRQHKDILDWDQIILEYDRWVHFGLRVGLPPRGDVLRFDGQKYERLL